MAYQQTGLPRWRGFNLLGLFTSHHDGVFMEEDFQLISELGFDFVRIPMSYRNWTVTGDISDPSDVYKVDTAKLESVDASVRLGEKYGLHVNLNFHRAPGYCINPGEKEPFDLWHDAEAVKAFAWHWEMFAKRYAGIPSEKLSFDLVNEPLGEKQGVTHADHRRAVEAAVKAIRAIDSARLIVADGMDCGNTPCPELADLNIGESCRAYVPMSLTHHRAGWWQDHALWTETPHWPEMANEDGIWNRERLYRHYEVWAKMSHELGIGVHCGEGGVYTHTPHAVILPWMEDVMDILQGFNIGYALWNFRGDFGIMDSGRKDCPYVQWRGHQLDKGMLDILKRH